MHAPVSTLRPTILSALPANNSHNHPADLICVIAILLVLALQSLPGIASGGLGWSDAPNHTFDGIFILEFFKQHPSGGLCAWAEQFYLHHPALGIVVYYPPGFAIFEAVIFGLFGVNIVTARLTVLLFAAGACLLVYALGRRWFDRWTGLFAALLLVTCPHGTLWLRDVMLEWPATFWILAAVFAYDTDRIDFAQGHHRRWAVGLFLCLIMTYMTKQTAGFIFPVLILHAAITGGIARGSYMRQGRFIGPVLLAAICIGAYHLWARQYAALPGQLLRPDFDLSQAINWPGEILGWPLLGVAALGMVTLIARPLNCTHLLLLLWFGAWTGFCLSISAKEPRYFFYAIIPLCFAAPRFLMAPERMIVWRRDRGRIVLLSLLVASQWTLTRSQFVGPLPDYAPAVCELAGRADADLVLVDAVRDGEFVFDIYQNKEAQQRLIPLRASKVLYARAAREKYSYQQFVQTPDEIVGLLNRYGIRYIVIESQLPETPYVDADPPPRKLLRELLRSDPRFKLERAWPLRCGDPAWNDVRLCLYSYPGCPPRTSKNLSMSFPAMNREIILQLP
jgi:glycerol uptake facilitator-like aquaporin